MLKHYLTTALRNFLRFKSTTLINVFGLALGLACFVAAIGVLAYIRSADRSLPNSDRIVMVLDRFTDKNTQLNGPLMAWTPAALALSIRKEFPGLPVAYAYHNGEVPVVVEGQRKFASIVYADPDYLNIVDLPRAQLAAGNPLLTPRSVVLSEATALQLFGTTDVLGRTIRLRDALDVTIAAVLKPLQEPSHTSDHPFAVFDSDALIASRDTQDALYQAVTGRTRPAQPLWTQWIFTFSSATYVLLPEDGSLTAAELESRLDGIEKRNGSPEVISHEFKVTSLSAAWLNSLDTILFNGSKEISITSLLLVLAFTVLGVACANYANLAFAQTTMHAREIGLRKTIGASRVQLIHQAMIDAGLQVIAAVAIALILVVGIGATIQARTELPLLSAIGASADFWLAIAGLVLSVTGLIALYPALILSRVKPAQALRTSPHQITSGTGSRLLLATQFIATSALTVVLTVVYSQNSSAQRTALQDEDVVVWLGFNHSRGSASFDTWRTELLRSPAIKAVSSTSTPPWSVSFAGMFGLKSVDDKHVNPNLSNVSYDFEKVFDHKVIAGRAFDRSLNDTAQARGTSTNVMIDETLAKHLGFANPADAVGQAVRQAGGAEGAPPVTVIGVVANKPLRLQPFLDFVGTVYVADDGSSGRPIMRIDKSRVGEGVKAIDEVWSRLVPVEAVERTFADEEFARSYAIYKIIGTALTTVAAIAMTIAILGAFGFALFVSNRRAHEIGIRKTLGASVMRILTMLLRDFSKPVLVANIIGWPLAYIAAQKYLSTFEQRIELTIWPFAFGLVFTLAIAWLAVGGQAWRAASAIPANVLRHE